MKKLFELGNKYAKQSTWKDFALVKLCLLALGILVGIHLNEKLKKVFKPIAYIVFFTTYFPLMFKLFDVMKKDKSKKF